MQNNKVRLPFVKKEEVAKDTFAFYFLRPQEGFDFFPGQYVSVSLENNTNDTFRDFSIASSPLETKYISIITKIRRTEFKKNLFTLKKNDTVWFSKPAGGFILDHTDPRQKIFLAGGVGIIPFFSMVRYALDKGVTVPITIISSFAAKEEMIYYQELMKFTTEHEHISVVFTVTREESTWIGEKGRISQEKIKKYVADTTVPVFYLAGSPGFVVAMEELLEEMKVALKNIRMEQFTGY